MSSIVPAVKQLALKEGTKIFYREIGDVSKPKFLLLHGYPTSSLMFRNLMPLLAQNFHLVAPDLPGFGFTDYPADYDFKFANIADTIDSFVKEIGWNKFAIFIFDYGSPVGLRLALKDPARITAIVSQNGNAYYEGVDDRFWGPLKQYWQTNEDDPTFISNLSDFVNDKKNIDSQYYLGVANPDAVDPAPGYLDEVLIKRPGQAKIQVGLFYDYKNNIAMYDQFHQYFRSSNVPVLLTWGKNDVIFNVDGAEGFKKDVKDLKIVYYDTGHFALETHVNEIADEIIQFLGPRVE